jgi:ABC-type multidrug transport system ATPase subunit
MQSLFIEVLALCREVGLLKVGRLALDGTKVKANASRHKAMSYDRMTSEEQRLQQEIDELLKQAQAADDADDEQHGSARGDELPEELARRETRLQKIQEAKAALEEQARRKAAAHAAKLEAAGGKPRKNPDDAVPPTEGSAEFHGPRVEDHEDLEQGFRSMR